MAMRATSWARSTRSRRGRGATSRSAGAGSRCSAPATAASTRRRPTVPHRGGPLADGLLGERHAGLPAARMAVRSRDGSAQERRLRRRRLPGAGHRRSRQILLTTPRRLTALNAMAHPPSGQPRGQSVPPPRMAPLAKLPIFLDLAGRARSWRGSSAARGLEGRAAGGVRRARWSCPGRGPHGQMSCWRPGQWAPGRSRSSRALGRRAPGRCRHRGPGGARRARRQPSPPPRVPRACRSTSSTSRLLRLPVRRHRQPLAGGGGISTDGAAPDPGPGHPAPHRGAAPARPRGLGGGSRRLRDRIAAARSRPALRRAFWERFVDLAFTGEPGPCGRASSRHPRRRPDASARGQVILVGAGPGDAELLTLKAVRALQSADVILYDELVSPEMLESGRREAERGRRVGKRGGRPRAGRTTSMP